jgi:hypothetical protein
MQLTLTNFNTPISLKRRFDDVCRASGRTRTSVLVELMENYTMAQGKVLATRNDELQKVDQTLEKSRRIMSFKEFLAAESGDGVTRGHRNSTPDFDLPSPFMSDGREDW